MKKKIYNSQKKKKKIALKFSRKKIVIRKIKIVQTLIGYLNRNSKKYIYLNEKKILNQNHYFFIFPIFCQLNLLFIFV